MACTLNRGLPRHTQSICCGQGCNYISLIQTLPGPKVPPALSLARGSGPTPNRTVLASSTFLKSPVKHTPRLFEWVLRKWKQVIDPERQTAQWVRSEFHFESPRDQRAEPTPSVVLRISTRAPRHTFAHTDT